MSDLIDQFELKSGDFVVVTGNFNRFIFKRKREDKKYDANALIDEIILRIGRGGTLAFQTFSWDFCHGLGFSVKDTKSKTGALGNLALKREDFTRMAHPIYSFAVWGRYKNELANLNNVSSFADDSPFGFMRRLKANMIIVNLELNHSFTFVHHAEQICGIDYRFEKDFNGIYVDKNGEKSNKTYSMFVRKDGVITDLKPLEMLFLKSKAMKINETGEDEIKIINLSRAYEIIADDIKNNGARSLHKLFSR